MRGKEKRKSHSSNLSLILSSLLPCVGLNLEHVAGVEPRIEGGLGGAEGPGHEYSDSLCLSGSVCAVRAFLRPADPEETDGWMELRRRKT